jgi:hypothetical protein
VIASSFRSSLRLKILRQTQPPTMFRQFNRLCKRSYATILKGQRGTAENPLRIGLIPADGIGNEVIPVTLPFRRKI